jgi:hypothetical protein
VIDYDSTCQRFYEHWRASSRRLDPPVEELGNDDILKAASFHSLNAYALVMRTIARFERALGRGVSWGFDGQLLNIVPYAFQEANAFYSRDDNALLFGYFPASTSGEWVYTALSHDIIVHETTHALVDGIRTRYLDHALPDQAGFHQGFADVIALLSAMTLPSLIHNVLLALDEKHFDGENLLRRSSLNVDTLGGLVLAGLAEQFGEELSGVRPAAPAFAPGVLEGRRHPRSRVRGSAPARRAVRRGDAQDLHERVAGAPRGFGRRNGTDQRRAGCAGGERARRGHARRRDQGARLRAGEIVADIDEIGL